MKDKEMISVRTPTHSNRALSGPKKLYHFFTVSLPKLMFSIRRSIAPQQLTKASSSTGKILHFLRRRSRIA
jgi:hypothetical protein